MNIAKRILLPIAVGLAAIMGSNSASAQGSPQLKIRYRLEHQSDTRIMVSTVEEGLKDIQLNLINSLVFEEGQLSESDFAWLKSKKDEFLSLYWLTIEDSSTPIPAECFSGLLQLNHVSVEMVTSIGKRAFSNCPNLSDLYALKVQTLGEGCLSNCPLLRQVVIPAVENIPDSAFTNDGSLSILGLSMPPSVSPNAFEGCPTPRYIPLNDSKPLLDAYDKSANNGLWHGWTYRDVYFVIDETETLPYTTMVQVAGKQVKIPIREGYHVENFKWYKNDEEVPGEVGYPLPLLENSYYSFTMPNDNVRTKGDVSKNLNQLEFNPNGGLGNMDRAEYPGGRGTTNLPKCTFTRAGYTFIGWATATGATEVTYTDQQSIPRIRCKHGVTVTLYAVWKKTEERKEFTITHQVKGEGGDLTVEKADGTVVASGEKLPEGTIIRMRPTATVPDHELKWLTCTAEGKTSELLVDEWYAVKSDMQITATFAESKQHVKIWYEDSVPGGRIEVTAEGFLIKDDRSSLEEGTTIELTLKPSEGYRSRAIVISGELVPLTGNKATYTLKGQEAEIFYCFDRIPTSKPKPQPDPNPTTTLLSAAQVAPNPFGDLLTVENAADVLGYQLLNLLGMVVASGTHSGSQRLQIATESLPTGFYLLVLQSAEGSTTLRAVKRYSHTN